MIITLAQTYHPGYDVKMGCLLGALYPISSWLSAVQAARQLQVQYNYNPLDAGLVYLPISALYL